MNTPERGSTSVLPMSGGCPDQKGSSPVPTVTVALPQILIETAISPNRFIFLASPTGFEPVLPP